MGTSCNPHNLLVASSIFSDTQILVWNICKYVLPFTFKLLKCTKTGVYYGACRPAPLDNLWYQGLLILLALVIVLTSYGVIFAR